jgi:hypothetical protein
VLGPSHWLHEISLPKRVCHHFWPGLLPLANNTLPINQEFDEALGLIIPKKDLALMGTSCLRTLKTIENLAEKHYLPVGTCLNLQNSF